MLQLQCPFLVSVIFFSVYRNYGRQKGVLYL